MGKALSTFYRVPFESRRDDLKPLEEYFNMLSADERLLYGNRAKSQQSFFELALMRSKARFEVSIDPIGGGDEAARVVPR